MAGIRDRLRSLKQRWRGFVEKNMREPKKQVIKNIWAEKLHLPKLRWTLPLALHLLRSIQHTIFGGAAELHVGDVPDGPREGRQSSAKASLWQVNHQLITRVHEENTENQTCSVYFGFHFYRYDHISFWKKCCASCSQQLAKLESRAKPLLTNFDRRKSLVVLMGFGPSTESTAASIPWRDWGAGTLVRMFARYTQMRNDLKPQLTRPNRLHVHSTRIPTPQHPWTPPAQQRPRQRPLHSPGVWRLVARGNRTSHRRRWPSLLHRRSSRCRRA